MTAAQMLKKLEEQAAAIQAASREMHEAERISAKKKEAYEAALSMYGAFQTAWSVLNNEEAKANAATDAAA